MVLMRQHFTFGMEQREDKVEVYIFCAGLFYEQRQL